MKVSFMFPGYLFTTFPPFILGGSTFGSIIILVNSIFGKCFGTGTFFSLKTSNQSIRGFSLSLFFIIFELCDTLYDL